MKKTLSCFVVIRAGIKTSIAQLKTCRTSWQTHQILAMTDIFNIKVIFYTGRTLSLLTCIPPYELWQHQRQRKCRLFLFKDIKISKIRILAL